MSLSEVLFFPGQRAARADGGRVVVGLEEALVAQLTPTKDSALTARQTLAVGGAKATLRASLVTPIDNGVLRAHHAHGGTGWLLLLLLRRVDIAKMNPSQGINIGRNIIVIIIIAIGVKCNGNGMRHRLEDDAASIVSA